MTLRRPFDGAAHLLAALIVGCSSAADVPCSDSGPWPCHEEGCPAPVVSCSDLSGDCNRLFSNVWKEAPDGLGPAHVWEHCPKTCNKCGAKAQAKAKAPSGDSKCVMWRQTSDCSANGKRQSANDRACSMTIKKGSSGYCECEGGVRAAESTCEHAEVCRERESTAHRPCHAALACAVARVMLLPRVAARGVLLAVHV